LAVKGVGGIAHRGRSLISTIALFTLFVHHSLLNEDYQISIFQESVNLISFDVPDVVHKNSFFKIQDS